MLTVQKSFTTSDLGPSFKTNQKEDTYLSGYVKVPKEVLKVELALYTKEGNPHPNLLFVTPHFKRLNEKPKAMKAEDYKITLELNRNGDLVHGMYLEYLL